MTRPDDQITGMVPRVCVLVVGLCLALGGHAHAQSAPDVSVTAEARPSEVGTAGRVTFRIRVQGAPLSAIETPEPPPTANLVLREATPTTRRELSFDQGSLSRRVTFEWTYEPLRVGIGRIQPASFRIRGETYTTDEVRVRIVPQAQRPRRAPTAHVPPAPDPQRPGRRSSSGLDPRDLFIQAAVSSNTAYQNEQVTAEYRLFFRPGVRLRQSRMADAWDAPGFWREELDVASRPTPRMTERYGQSYKTIVLKRVALFPTRTGRLEIDPLQIRTEARPSLRMESARAPRSRYEPVTLSSERLVVKVRSLPPTAPPAFNGAVGQFSIDTRIGADSVEVGEAVTLTARIQGTGNIPTISPPRLESPADFEAYDPSVETKIDRSGAVVRGTKTFTYTLVPRSNGRYTLPPVQFAYFDPAAETYETHRSEPVTLHVTGDVLPRATSRTGEGLPIGEIAGLRTEGVRWVRADRPPLYARPWAYAALLIPVALAIGGVAVRRRGTFAGGSDRESVVEDVAQRYLHGAREHVGAEGVRPFYRAVEQGVLSFLDERLDLPRTASGMTGSAIDRHLAHNGVSRAEREALRSLLETCNEAQFTPAEPSPEAREATLEHAEALLRRLDEALPADPEPA